MFALNIAILLRKMYEIKHDYGDDDEEGIRVEREREK